MSDDLEFIVIDDIPEYIFCIGDDEENEQVIAISGKDGAFKYEKVAELPTTGEDGVLYLVPKSHTTQTASGNPISVNITDNAGKIESLKLDGDTFQQTYTGKNLLKYPYWNTTTTTNGVTFTDNGDCSVTANGTASPQALFWVTRDNWRYAPESLVVPAGTYTIKGTGYSFYRTIVTAYGKTQGLIATYQVGIDDVTFTLEEEASLTVRLSVQSGVTADNFVFRPQLEAGSTSSSYEPYVGGQPSPSPSYPQDINVVTGTQTVSINGTDYSIDLGSIELCKLGTYQDYIYKDGENWKVHKWIGKYTYDGTESNWAYSTNVGDGAEVDGVFYRVKPTGADGTNYPNPSVSISDRFISGVRTPTKAGTFIIGSNITFASPSTAIDNATEWTQWLASNNTTVYYKYRDDSVTDTVITDATLIAQLEAVRTAALSTGSNTISNTATGTNLAGDLELGYYGYDPLNKYDKYFWLDVDGEYESL
jgi:hypothetical protein